MSERNTELKRQGNRALAARRYGEARTAFNALVAESPSSPDGYLGLAKTLEREHDHRSIISLIEPVVEEIRTPGLRRALADAYRVLANQGDGTAVDPAIKWYLAYLSERPDPVGHFYLGELYREHKHDDVSALEHLKKSWSLDPGSRTVYQAALVSAKRLGRLDEVRELMEAWRVSGRE